MDEFENSYIDKHENIYIYKFAKIKYFFYLILINRQSIKNINYKKIQTFNMKIYVFKKIITLWPIFDNPNRKVVKFIILIDDIEIYLMQFLVNPRFFIE